MDLKHKIIQWNCRGLKVSNGAKIRNRYNQVPHLTQDTNGKVTNSQKTPQTRAKRSALSQQVTTKPNYNEVSLLISECNPSVFCFQETFLKPDDNVSLRGFNIYNYVHTDFLRPSGVASIFEKSSFPQKKIDLQTELQATTVSLTLDREIIICSVYIPPSFSLYSQHLDNLLQQLPSPYILLGDFNGHNILWGDQNNDSRDELIENFITKNDICNE